MITTLFVITFLRGNLSKSKIISLIVFVILREVLLILLCIFSFMLLGKMKDDIENSNSRLDWADRIKGCTD